MPKHYLYKLRNNVSYTHKHAVFDDVEFSNEFINIKDGTLTVYSGYAWDGCTPRIHVCGLFSIGTPNGAIKEGKPWTYYASLVHDVLIQFRHELPFTKTQVTAVFEDILRHDKWPLTSLYVTAVKKLGPQDFPII